MRWKLKFAFRGRIVSLKQEAKESNLRKFSLECRLKRNTRDVAACGEVGSMVFWICSLIVSASYHRILPMFACDEKREKWFSVRKFNWLETPRSSTRVFLPVWYVDTEEKMDTRSSSGVSITWSVGRGRLSRRQGRCGRGRRQAT